MKPRARITLPIVLSFGAVGAIVGINAMASKNNPTPVDISSPQQLEASGPPRVQPDFQRSPAEASKYTRELARRSRGKFDSLSADDRSFLNGMTAGHGKELLQNNWNSISGEQKSAKPTTIR